MKKVFFLVTVLFFGGIILLVSCQKELFCEDCKENKPPLAIAGADQIITLPKDSAALDGSASTDPDGTITSYKWIKISGPVSSNINTADKSRTTVKGLVTGVYKFELTVTDNGGLTGKDTMQIMVDDPVVNQPPVACAGLDQTITLPASTVTLDGSCSSDPDNNIVSYTWTKISGTAANINAANAPQTQVTGLTQGVYQFELKVTDASGLFAKDTVQVSVNMPCNNTGWQTLNGTFTTAGTLFEARFPAAAAAGSKVVFAGGWVYGLCGACSGEADFGTATVDIYDLGTQNWSQAQLSLGRGGISAITNGNKMFFAGGHRWECGSPVSRHVSYDNVDIYDVSNNTWSVAHLSQHRTYVGAATVGDKVLFAGGAYYTNNFLPAPIYVATNKVDIYNLSSNQWSTATLSSAGTPTASTIGNKVYFILGNLVDIYDNTTNSWTSSDKQTVIASLSPPTGMNGVNGFVSFGDNIVFFSPTEVGIRNITTGISSVACMPVRQEPFMVNDNIIFLTDATHFNLYNTVTRTWYNGTTNIPGSGGPVPRIISSSTNVTYFGGGNLDSSSYCQMYLDKVLKFSW